MENRRGRANGAMNESDRKGRICISTRRDIDRERDEYFTRGVARTEFRGTTPTKKPDRCDGRGGRTCSLNRDSQREEILDASERAPPYSDSAKKFSPSTISYLVLENIWH